MANTQLSNQEKSDLLYRKDLTHAKRIVTDFSSTRHFDDKRRLALELRNKIVAVIYRADLLKPTNAFERLSGVKKRGLEHKSTKLESLAMLLALSYGAPLVHVAKSINRSSSRVTQRVNKMVRILKHFVRENNLLQDYDQKKHHGAFARLGYTTRDLRHNSNMTIISLVVSAYCYEYSIDKSELIRAYSDLVDLNFKSNISDG